MALRLTYCEHKDKEGSHTAYVNYRTFMYSKYRLVLHNM